MNRLQQILVNNDEAPITRGLRRGLAAGECEDELEIINSWTTDLVVTEVSTPNMRRLGVCR